MSLKLCRRIVQTAFLCLLIAVPFLNEREISIVTGTLYAMSFGPIDLTDPLSGLQVIMLTLSATKPLIISMLIPIAFTFVFGRVYCSWLCPQNLFSEMGDILASRLHIRRMFSVSPTPRPRWAMLAVVLAGSMAVGFPLASLISAPGIISLQISTAVFDSTVGLESALIGIILAGEFFLLRRFWCNYVCSVGTTLSVFRCQKTLKVRFSEDDQRKCIHCGACSRACQFGLDPMREKIYPLCHNCGDCIAACEKSTAGRNPLKFTF